MPDSPNHDPDGSNSDEDVENSRHQTSRHQDASYDYTAVPDESEGGGTKELRYPIGYIVEDVAEGYLEGRKPSRITRNRLIRLGFELTTVIIALYFLVPLLPGLRDTGEDLLRSSWWLIAVLVVMMIGVQLAYGELVRTTLTAMDEEPPFWLIQRTTVVGTSVGKILPAGTTVALALIVATLRKAGLDAARSTAALASAGMISSIILVLLLPVGVALALVAGQTGGFILTALIAATLVLVAAVFARPALKRIEPVADWIARMSAKFRRGYLTDRINPPGIKSAIMKGADGVLQLTGDRRVLAKASAWAAANWLLDYLALVLIAMALGSSMPLGGLLLAFVLAQLATALPITPGGIGLVEAVMIAYLTATGAPAADSASTVLGWRLVSHWLLIPVGLALLPGLGKAAIRSQQGKNGNTGPQAAEPSTG